MSFNLTTPAEPTPSEWPAGLARPTMSREARYQLDYLGDSARVRRWHTEPVVHQQTVGEHTYSVQMLVLLLTSWTASRSLLIAALMHDTAERKFGDVPGPTKRLLGLKATFDTMEDGFMRSAGLCIPDLTEHEERLLKLADMLEGALFCAFEVRRGNREMRDAFRNYLNYIRTALQVDDLYGAIVYNELLKEYEHAFNF